MSANKSGSPLAARGEPRRQALIAAYREGLGLAAVAVICSPGQIRIAAVQLGDDALFAAEDAVQARWWCRRAEAERIAAAATARLRRRESRDDSNAVLLATEAIGAAARRLNVALQADQEVCAEAVQMIARVDEQIAGLQRAGELKAINSAYRSYRIEATARGEKILRYADWIEQYKAKLVRELAATLRHV